MYNINTNHFITLNTYLRNKTNPKIWGTIDYYFFYMF